jgi:hypothetical protein
MVRTAGFLYLDQFLAISSNLIFMASSNTETAAAAMAVTAPTYVLEESLSSQRLWKDTAGNRPPQPVEERMFFEKMWAQNFAKSQVNYQMPVEVLTATSPISLSPFAEGGSMEISAAAAAAAGDGGNYPQYTIGMNTPANTHVMITSSRMAAGGGSRQAPPRDMDEPASRSGLKEAPRPAPPTVLPPMAHQDIVNKVARTESGDFLTVMVRGDNVFGTTVSKSFACSDEKGGPITGVDTVNISIASYRVVEVSASRSCIFRSGQQPLKLFVIPHRLSSRARTANTHNSWSFIVKAVSGIPSAFGSDIVTLMIWQRK